MTTTTSRPEGVPAALSDALSVLAACNRSAPRELTTVPGRPEQVVVDG